MTVNLDVSCTVIMFSKHLFPSLLEGDIDDELTMHECALTLSHTHMHMYTSILTCTHTYTYNRHAHIHTHTLTHTHTHTHTIIITDRVIEDL